MEERKYIPASLIGEFIYCPRNFYYRFVEGAEDKNSHIIEGVIKEEIRKERMEIVKRGKKQKREVTIYSDYFQLVARLDVVEENEDIYPVEYKKGFDSGEQLYHKAQLCAQGMILEEYLGRPIKYGFLYYQSSRKRKKVEFDSTLKEIVEKTIFEAKEVARNDIPPLPVNDNRCKECSLNKRCMPGEVFELTKKTGKLPKTIPSNHLGRILYIDEQGTKVLKDGERVVVTKDDETIKEIPVSHLDEMILVGGVNLTTPTVKLLLKQQIPVHYLSIDGKYLGSFQPVISKNSLLRIAQFRVYDDENARLALSKQFILGKLSNMRTLLVRYTRRMKGNPDFDLKTMKLMINEIGKMKEKIDSVTNKN